jgi:hypothetical protein
MDNKYVFSLNKDFFDMDEIYMIYKRRKDDAEEGLGHFQRSVTKEPYLVYLMEKYPFLGTLYNFYDMTESLPLHVDNPRKCTINIPLWNCNDSETVVYEFIKKPTEKERQDIIDDLGEGFWSFPVKKEEVKEAYRFSLTGPVLFNTECPHEVLTNSNSKLARSSISWGIIPDYSFNEVKKILIRK